MNTNRHECVVGARLCEPQRVNIFGVSKVAPYSHIVRYSLVLVMALMVTGCCTSITTSVRNESGRDIQLTVMRRLEPTETVKIRAASTGRCKGVMSSHPGFAPDFWIVSDGQSRFTFSDVSLIATLPSRFVSSSRFTRDFPCKRVTQHVRITPEMTIHAVRVIGYTESEPTEFPIRYTVTETINTQTGENK
ncbi:MAG: hypothetical protein EXS24_01060 [Pedosphaera sp.]|nr:hypothetical protein [Pedosphaera sp.]